MPVTICPIALVSSCTKCPIFKVCPVKGVIGDWRPDRAATGEDTTRAKHASKPKRGAHGDHGKPKRKGAKRGKR